MNRRAVRRLKKQDKANPGARRKRAVEASQRNRNLEAINGNISARQAILSAPSVKELAASDLKTGDAPEEVPNDSGYGTKTEYPQMGCTTCKAKFHTSDKLALHTDTYHGDDDMLFGTKNA